MTAGFATIDISSIQSMLDHAMPHGRELGIRVIDVAPSTATMALDYQARLVGNPETGFLHGGVITTLVDTVSAMSVFAALRQIIGIATLDLRIDYLKPATAGRDLIARADCYKTTRQIAFTRCTAYHDRSDPIASCVGTFMIGSASRSDVRPTRETRRQPGADR